MQVGGGIRFAYLIRLSVCLIGLVQDPLGTWYVLGYPSRFEFSSFLLVGQGVLEQGKTNLEACSGGSLVVYLAREEQEGVRGACRTLFSSVQKVQRENSDLGFPV